MPIQIVFENSDEIEYLYDDNGTKLKKTVTDNTTNPLTVTTTHYIGGFQYNGNKMDFFPTAGGYVKVTHSSGGGIGVGTTTYNYVFNYTDHLGNVRLRYAKNPVNQWLEILEEDHYYPFGLKHKGYNAENYVFASLGEGPVELIPTNPNALETYKYKFGGFEYQDEFNINVYDFGARNYDPALGRWMNMDPLAEQMRRHSPYNFAFNNPIYWIDPDGMMPVASIGSTDDWINNGDGTWTAEAGDSAATLATDAGISFEQANALVQDQLGANYMDNGIEKSNVEVGDIVAIPEQVEAFCAQQQEIAQQADIKAEVNKNEQEIAKTEKTIDSLKDEIKESYRQEEMIIESHKPMQGDPDKGLRLVISYKTTKVQVKRDNDRKLLNKNQGKADSLKKVNENLKKN